MQQNTPQLAPPTFDDFLAREVIGTPDQCLEQIREMESWGVNYLRVNFGNDAAQDAVARLLLPRLAESARGAGLARVDDLEARTEAVLAANESFYQAFNQKDPESMARIWAQSAECTCIHPGWNVISGREKVIQSWTVHPQ